MNFKELLDEAAELGRDLWSRDEVRQSVEIIKTELEKVWIEVGGEVTRWATSRLALIFAGQ